MTVTAWIALGALSFTVLSTLFAFIVGATRVANRISIQVEVTTSKLEAAIVELSHDIRDLRKTIEKIEARQWDQAQRLAVLEAQAGNNRPAGGQ